MVKPILRDPTTGRYIQADPLGLVDGASVYGYALQNPGRYVDPRGECFGPYVFLLRWCIAGAIYLVELATDYLLDEDCYTWEDFFWFNAWRAVPGPRGGFKHNRAGRGGGGGAKNHGGFEGKYESNPKHKQKRPGVGAEPTNGPDVLKNSHPVGAKSNARVGYDPSTGEIVVFRPHKEGTYHGYVSSWTDLPHQTQNALRDAGVFNGKGRLLK